MQLLEGLSGLRSLPPGAVISIGNYDGVHVGHQVIIAHMKSAARAAPIAIVTFEPHPLTVLRPALAPPRLTSGPQKAHVLESLGVDYLIELPPDPNVLGLTAEEFWTILRDEVRPARIVEGPVFNFGRGRGGTIQQLQTWAEGTNVRVEVLPGQTRVLSDRTIVGVSSSIIRWLLGYGRVADAAILLGRPHELAGTVVKGFQRGRTIGVPTANLACGDQLIPADGVYAGQVQVDDKTYAAAISIGTAPTFEKQQYQIEAHLIGFNGNLYDRPLNLEFLSWMRDQMKFPSVDSLKTQLARDISDVSAVFASIADAPRPID